ncbi:MAG: T9SS type A sorting domain-containing protein [Bacteroidota bacterium]
MRPTIFLGLFAISSLLQAQTSFCPDDPPLNSWLADSPYPIYHRNNYAQASTCLPGIFPEDSVVIKVRADIPGSASPWIYFSDRYPNGERVILYANSTHVFKFIDDGTQLLAIDSLRIDFDPLGSVGYNFLLSKDNIWFTYDPDDNPSQGEYTRLFKLTDADTTDPYSDIVVLDTFSFEGYNINKVGAYSLNYSGHIVSNSHADPVNGWATTGVIDQNFQLLDTLRYSLFPDEEVHHNSIAIQEDNAYYIVTTHRLIQFTWDGNQVAIGWEALYDFVNDGPTGNFANGSGTTPTLMGWGAGKDQLVLVADGHANNHLVAFWRELPPGWTGVPGMDLHFADSISIPYAQSFGNLFQSIENSPTVHGYEVAIAQFNGFLGYDCMNEKGVQKFRWDTLAHQLVLEWATDAVNTNGVLSYSSGSNLVYGTGKEADCAYYYYGLEWETGELAVRILLGPEGNFPEDPFYDQGVNHIIDEEGSIYFSGSRSLVKLERHPPVLSAADETITSASLSFAPNPTADWLSLHGITGGEWQVELYSLSGQRLLSQPAVSSAKLDLRPFPAGIYVVRAQQGSQRFTRKVVKMEP